MIEGINLGAGAGWSHRGWAGLDKMKKREEFLNAETALPYTDKSVLHVFSAHFFEHVDDATASNLFKESYRVLAPGGYIRAIVPDIDKLIHRYREGKEMFGVTAPGRNWANYGIVPTTLNILLHFLSNFDYKGENGFYRGPPLTLAKDHKLVQDKLESLSNSEFCEWVLSHIPLQDERVTSQHINWWNEKKLKQFLIEAGFTDVERSTYQGSQSEAMKGSKFDQERRQSQSLYVEARKL